MIVLGLFFRSVKHGWGPWWVEMEGRERRSEIGLADQGNDPALGVAVAFDVSLGGCQRPMTGQFLDVADVPTCPMDCPRCIGDKGSSARV